MIKMKNNAMFGILVIGLGLLLGNLVTTGIYSVIDSVEQNKTRYEMIQLIPKKDRPNFKVTPTDFNPNKFSPPVSLHVAPTEQDETGFVCSGTVISNDYVITAAHCLVDENGRMLKSIKVAAIPTLDGLTSIQDATPVGLNQRADYALIKGDFSLFQKVMIDTTMSTIMSIPGKVLTCGFPWGSKFTCYVIDKIMPCGSQLCSPRTPLFPGMSGGPVLTITQFGPILSSVNTGVTGEYIVVSPLVGLFETLGVEVVK